MEHGPNKRSIHLSDRGFGMTRENHTVNRRQSAPDARRGMGRGLLLGVALMLVIGSVHARADLIFQSGFEEGEQPPVPVRLMNDTGIVWSGHATSGNASTCDVSHPAGQDCRYGRDAEAAAGTLTKVGASTPNNGIANGFDYTKISNSGDELPAEAALGSGPADWACTRDNVTGLVWEVKSTGGLRSKDHTYTWYDSDSPDGNPGTADGGSCETSGRCDTEKYAEDVNAAQLCGFSDWRMPTIKELRSIVDHGRFSPAIDLGFFPNTTSSDVWPGSPFAYGSGSAWNVDFNDGSANYGSRGNNDGVRLARGGQ